MVPLSLMKVYQGFSSGGGIKCTSKTYKNHFVCFRDAIQWLCNSMCEETHCIHDALYLLINRLVWVIGFLQERVIWSAVNCLRTLSSVGVTAVSWNLHDAVADCYFLGSDVIWISLQDEGRMPWERKELLESVKKVHSSFVRFNTMGGVSMELSVEFVLIQCKSGRIS